MKKFHVMCMQRKTIFFKTNFNDKNITFLNEFFYKLKLNERKNR